MDVTIKEDRATISDSLYGDEIDEFFRMIINASWDAWDGDGGYEIYIEKILDIHFSESQKNDIIEELYEKHINPPKGKE